MSGPIVVPADHGGSVITVKAALIVLAVAALAAAMFVGYKAGRQRERMRRQGVDPKWVEQVKGYLSDLVYPPDSAADLDDMVVLPDAKRDVGRKLLYAAPGAAEARAKLRRQFG